MAEQVPRAPSSTSTAAAWTCASRTTRTSRRSRGPPATAFARYWLHNGWVTLGGEKMSKSLGNTALVDEVVQRVRPVELRYYLVAPHYRSTIEFTDAALEEAGVAYRRLESFVRRAAERVGADAGKPVLCAELHRRAGRRPRHPGRRRRDPRDGPRRATPRWPTATTPRSPARSARCAPCSACSASTRSTRSGPPAAATSGSTHGHRRPGRARARAAAGGPGPQGLRRRRRDPRPAHRPRRRRRGHPAGTPMGADPLMAGNSQRRGRTTGAGKKTATAGTGGKNRRSLAGRGATPPAEARPGHPAQRAGGRRRSGSGPTGPAPGSAPRRRPSCCSAATRCVEALRAQIPATALYVVTGDNQRAHRRADRRGDGSWPPTAGCRCSRWARPSSTGCPRARCTRASACRCRPTTTRTPTTCSTSPATPAARR